MVARIVVEFESSQTALFSQRFEGDKITEGQFEIIGLALTAGDVLTYEIVAEDNHAGADGRGQTGRSAPLRINSTMLI